ncbi:unnamed protein product [Medioppia subpectinata]|uniref:EF-hand domain-containing protein n=1 Tax=Medioppia subpectinata TaxID=1979941 RepID=A0A7R9Q7H1_9ACAR|nr:unnamed protein product [Medioppia subpectinata]CAG2115573.1 unnamed protein product [Medioppia subpectinata]
MVTLFFENFLPINAKDCPDGRLTEQAFLKIYQQFFPKGDPKKFASFVFRVFDDDKDGMITFEEFIRALSTTSRGTFKLYDLDNDGYITREEMCSIIEAIYQMLGPNIENEEENAEKRVEMIFNHLDTNKDDKLSMDEFMEGSTQDPKIDGMITFEEFIRALSTTSRGTFKLYDLDNDGYITREEMCSIIEAIYQMLGPNIENEEENAEKRVEMIFNHLDTNKDDKLSMDEFMEGSTQDPKIVAALSLYNIHNNY